MNRRIYGVAAGCYSDYRIMAVFDEEADAKAWVDRLNSLSGEDDAWVYASDSRIELLPYFKSGEAPSIVKEYRADVVLWDNGQVSFDSWKSPAFNGTIKARSSSEWAHNSKDDPRPRIRYVRAPCYNGKGGRLEAEGLDEKAVVQCLSDRVAMFKAGAWDPRPRNEIEWIGGDEPS